MGDDNGILKIINSMEILLDRKFKEHDQILELKLEKKGKQWAEKTVKDTIESIGIEDAKKMHLRMNFLDNLMKLAESDRMKDRMEFIDNLMENEANFKRGFWQYAGQVAAGSFIVGGWFWIKEKFSKA